MKKLKPVKVTKHQVNLFGLLLVYFNRQRKAALRRSSPMKEPKAYIHPISLQGIYDALHVAASVRPVVKMAANVFFEQVYRGNSHTKHCSGWKLRNEPRLNAQVLALLPEVFEANTEFMYQLSELVLSKKPAKTEEKKDENTEQAGTAEQAATEQPAEEDVVVEVQTTEQTAPKVVKITAEFKFPTQTAADEFKSLMLALKTEPAAEEDDPDSIAANY